MAYDKVIDSAKLDREMKATANAIRTQGKTEAEIPWDDEIGYEQAVLAIKGGTELNFEVVGGTTQPSNPKENTIWVNTETEITGWEIRESEPESPYEGMVWIAVATSGYTEISVVSDLSIYINPSRCKQYVSSTWVDKKAMTYKGGEWNEWVTYLYRRGDTCDAITGGWQARGLKYSSTAIATTPTMQLNEDHIYGKLTQNGTNGNGGPIETKNSIDLTNYSLLVFEFDYYKAHMYAWTFLSAYSSATTVYDRNSSADLIMNRDSDEHSGLYVVDVSKLSGSYKVGAVLYVAGGPYTIELRIANVYLI